MNFEKELDEILNCFHLGENPKPSESIRAIEKAQQRIKKIYEAGYNEGIEQSKINFYEN